MRFMFVATFMVQSPRSLGASYTNHGPTDKPVGRQDTYCWLDRYTERRNFFVTAGSPADTSKCVVPALLARQDRAGVFRPRKLGGLIHLRGVLTQPDIA